MASSKPICLITGASSGIGAELADCAAADGFDLVLVARRLSGLANVAQRCQNKHNATVTILPADLGDATAPRVLAAELRAKRLDVHTLINNAGLGANGTVATLSLESQLHMIQVNITALTEMTRRLLPGLIERGTGAVMNVASTASFLPGPGMAVYYASKAYVLSFTEALGEELRDTNIHVSALCPGPTSTEFGAVAGNSASKLAKQKSVMMSAASVARSGWDGLLRNERVIVPGLANKFMVQALRATPRAVATKLSASVNASEAS